MKSEFITEGTDGSYFLVIPLGSKTRDKAIIKGGTVVNDILSSISIALKSDICFKNPSFSNSLKAISKRIWKVIK